MAKLRTGQKSDRVLKLLHGLGDPRTAATLTAFGFSQKDLDEGWRLLRDLRTVKLGTPGSAPSDPSAVGRLDDWENKWFPVASAALRRHHAAVHDKFFLNLTQTVGLDVINSVGTFVERHDALDKPAGGYGPEGAAARQLLELRGLNALVLGEARALLTSLASVRPAPVAIDPEEQAADLAKREADMWSWYLEWATIARSHIKNRRQLRELGFLTPRGTTVADLEEAEGDDAPTPPEAPAQPG